MTAPLQPLALLAELAPDLSPLASGLIIGLVLCLIAFQFWMLADCLLDRTDPIHHSSHSRGTWCLLILFLGWIAALHYFFAVRRPRVIRRRERRRARASQQPAR